MLNLMPLELVRKIEYALLEPQLSRAEVEAGCAAAVQSDCIAVVVKPHYIELACKVLKDTPVKVVAVVGFPHGGVTTATKMYETQDVLQRGADEIAMVINIGALRDGEDLVVRNDIAGVVKTARGHPITVILEAPLLTDEEKTRGCKIAEAAKATFIQTATGFAGSAMVADVRLLSAAYPNLKVKAAGGIATLDAAREMIGAGAARVVVSRNILASSGV
jgi:deoxyribose-phosphate aldolase